MSLGDLLFVAGVLVGGLVLAFFGIEWFVSRHDIGGRR